MREILRSSSITGRIISSKKFCTRKANVNRKANENLPERQMINDAEKKYYYQVFFDFECTTHIRVLESPRSFSELRKCYALLQPMRR